MTKESEINKLISEKIENLNTDDCIKDFILTILKWEKVHDHEEKPRYTEDFDKLIEKFSESLKGD